MSQTCSMEKCTRVSRWLCDCCEKHMCLQHLNDHNIALISQLNPLTDEINALGDRLEALGIHEAVAYSRQKLEQWRQDCYKKIDSYFEQKCQELDQVVHEIVGQQREKMNHLQLNITELINAQETTRQDIDSLTSTIRQLETNMKIIEQTCLTINTRPLLIDDTIISIETTTEHELNLSTISPVFRTIHRPKGSFRPFTVNDRYLLMHQEPNLCLFDRTLNIAKQITWSYDAIQDMCWSSTLNRFIVLGKNNILLINENTMAVDNVYTIKERQWLSGTCSDKVLFASTNGRASSIMEFALLPTVKLIKEWKYPLTCSKDEFIVSTAYNNGNLALMVVNVLNKLLRMELRYTKTLDPIWSFQINITWIHKLAFRCCSLPCNEWLIVDYETGRLLQITKDGKVKNTIKYQPTPCRAILFDINTLAVSTIDDVNLHTIQ
ncbi:unnamed protein product [Rotaria sp. Silwood1]|nr:unnamed protein product [Rotaria sp. Silwood1]CAF1062433.1 unnamed protein product [Rotaria sp. Silwood1]CAF3418035.1 unnamed protein product [Rotaria sp. Silwood1]CAF3427260.1 unnamed protein product [Rotaria sp. Silwood1]CAF4602832.1 unnamed protein product [Rotaria sp. Silwood1]